MNLGVRGRNLNFEVILTLNVSAEVEVKVRRREMAGGKQMLGQVIAFKTNSSSLWSLTEARTSLVELLQFLFFFSRMYLPFETN